MKLREMLRIENDHLNVGIKEQGAELSSVINKSDAFEHIWEGRPEIWYGQAPILFPIVGELNNGETTINGKQYKMRRHGFLRKMMPTTINKEEGSVELIFEANAQTLQQYPFNFRVTVGFKLDNNSLINTFKVENLGTDAMPFNIGAHPAFAIPFAKDETIEDCYIAFEKNETASRHMIDNNGLFTGELVPVLNNSTDLPITKDIFNDDALIFKDLQSRVATIKSKKSKKEVSVSFKDWPLLGVWAKPAAPYVCIEPWFGCADPKGYTDEFVFKELMMLLQPNASKDFSFSITIS